MVPHMIVSSSSQYLWTTLSENLDFWHYLWKM